MVLMANVILYLDDIPNSLGLKDLHYHCLLCDRFIIVQFDCPQGTL